MIMKYDLGKTSMMTYLYTYINCIYILFDSVSTFYDPCLTC